MAAVPANLDFQIGSIAKNVLHDLYYYYKSSCYYHILSQWS